MRILRGGRYPAPSRKKDLKMAYALGLFISLCSAPSIDGADGKKRADCLPASGGSEPADGGGVSAWSVRREDAQDKAEHGRYLLLRFLDELVKNP